MNTFVILKILATLMLPPASLAIGVVLWLLLRLVGWRRVAAVPLGLALLQTLVLSFPPAAGLFTRQLEETARKLVAGNQPCCYDAIVVLGGGIAPAAPPYTTEPELTDASDRIWQAARMFRAGAAPKIIVSGGSFVEQQGGPATTEAEAMRRFLLDLGVPGDAIVSEGKALNTIDNIRNVRELVKGGRVAIVTSAFHVPRAARLARQGGLDFAIFGVDWSVPSDAIVSEAKALNTIENIRNVRELVKGGRVAIVTSAFHVPRAARLASRGGLNFAIFGVNWSVPKEAIAWWDVWLPSVDALGDSNLAIKELVALTFDRRGDSLAP